MIRFRALLIVLAAVITVYTLFVGIDHGWNFVSPFLAQMAAMTWQGQFNLDFAAFLLLAALWCAWRNGFTLAAWGLALLGAAGGMLFLSIYLLYLSIRTGGDIKAMMLGARA